METVSKPLHIGYNIGKIREICGLKQDVLAANLGVSQQTISNIEKSEILEEKKLQEIAKALGVSPETIKNFSQEGLLSYFTGFYDQHNLHCDCNPIDRLVESYAQKELLYERLLIAEKAVLKAERDKVAYLEKLLFK